MRDEWSLATILASYLLQSIIIGLFQAKKILDLKVFSTEGFKMGGHAVEPTRATQWKVVLFFLVHYGIFHAVYAGFILSEGRPYWPDVLLSGAAFFANHLFSYFMNRNRAGKRIPNIGSMMFFPYIRIIPMHVFIVFGAFAAGTAFLAGLLLAPQDAGRRGDARHRALQRYARRVRAGAAGSAVSKPNGKRMGTRATIASN